MKSGGRRRRKSEEKASWLGREALTNIASDKCALAHLTVNLKTANFQHRIEGCGSARRGLCFGTIPCFACPSSLYLCGLLAVPQVKHGNEARILFCSRVFRSWGSRNEVVEKPSRMRTEQFPPVKDESWRFCEDTGGTRLSRPGFARASEFKIEREEMN